MAHTTQHLQHLQQQLLGHQTLMRLDSLPISEDVSL